MCLNAKNHFFFRKFVCKKLIKISTCNFKHLYIKTKSSHFFYTKFLKTKWRPSLQSNWTSIIPQIFSFFRYFSIFFWLYQLNSPSTWDIPMTWTYFGLRNACVYNGGKGSRLANKSRFHANNENGAEFTVR